MTATRQPAPASWRATARPTPVPAPVITAIWFEPMQFCLFLARGRDGALRRLRMQHRRTDGAARRPYPTSVRGKEGREVSSGSGSWDRNPCLPLERGGVIGFSLY